MKSLNLSIANVGLGPGVPITGVLGWVRSYKEHKTSQQVCISLWQLPAADTYMHEHMHMWPGMRKPGLCAHKIWQTLKSHNVSLKHSVLIKFILFVQLWVGYLIHLQNLYTLYRKGGKCYNLNMCVLCTQVELGDITKNDHDTILLSSWRYY